MYNIQKKLYKKINCLILNRNEANKNIYLCTCIYYERNIEAGNICYKTA